MREIRVTQNGNTYRLRWEKKIIGGTWIRGKAQNLTPLQMASFVFKVGWSLLAALGGR